MTLIDAREPTGNPPGRTRELRGPLSHSYGGAVALVVSSLIPYLVLSAAVLALGRTIAHSLGMSPSLMYLTMALSTAAYSAGTVLAVQFAVHLAARRMLVLYETLFTVASVLAAAAPDGDVFMAAFIAQGLCTSLMLIAAVPPLVTAWPASKMPTTGAIMNLCIFGAVAAGPSIGAFQLSSGQWRPLFWGVAAVAALALLFSILTFEDAPRQDPSAPWDLVAVGLTIVGCGSGFFGAGQLQASSRADPESLVPLIGGFVVLVALVAYQYRSRNPLMPVRAAATSVPVTGIFIALTTSAAAFGIMELLLQTLQKSQTAVQIGLLFLPEFGAAVVTAGLFGLLFKTRYTPVLALSGLLAVVAAAALLASSLPASGPLDAAVAGILGVGVGASVSPALFMAGFSLQSRSLQRVFAMIELMRGVTAFLVAPILVYLAGVLGANRQVGTKDAVWLCVGIAAAGFVGGTVLHLSGRPRLVAPDLESWQGGDEEPAWPSPPLFAELRRVSPRLAGVGEALMTKDRDQLTPEEPEDRGKVGPKRSAAREAEGPLDDSTGRGPASHGSDPDAASELGPPEGDRYT